MKSVSKSIKQVKVILVICFVLFSVNDGFSQYDTLHLNYSSTQAKPHDTTVAKIDKWVKSLNGKHIDLNVVAYYHRPEFKKFAVERTNELFLILNRKAMGLFTMQSSGAKKGEDSQRTRVDLIYKYSLTETEVKEKEKEAAAKKEEKKEEKKPKAEPKKKDKDEEVTKEEKKVKTKSDDEMLSGDKDKKSKDKSKKKEKSEEQIREETYGSPRVKDSGAGSWVKQKEVAQIKNSKIVVAQTGDPEEDKLFQDIVKDFWDFNKNVTTMPYKEAKALAKTDKSILIFIITRIKSKSMRTQSFGPISYRNVSSGSSVMLEDGKGDIIAASHIPAFGEGSDIAPSVLAFGVAAMNYMLKTMDEKNLSSNIKLKDAYKEKSEQLKLKKLYILEGWLDEKLTQQEIAEMEGVSLSAIKMRIKRAKEALKKGFEADS